MPPVLLRPSILVALLCAAVAALSGCAPSSAGGAEASAPAAGALPEPQQIETAIFAAGCFWCVEQAFDGVEGVRATTSGYTGGTVVNPSYRQVSAGSTGHYEAVRVRFDPSVVSYAELLDVFWHNVDPTDARGQFCDKGPSYLGAIFYRDENQRQLAEASKAALVADPQAPSPIVTEILRAGPFYEAEDYHQDYYRKNPLRYRYYKTACGRAARLEELWGPKAG
ncbi:MAG: peptide-methionine (S)-S-oxide reductase MsrA [Pseudomonadales bacterium]|jgi:peptide-methionine (S)-S-oxide reductase|nr:peptide-methionine (S)-S-oxide reductase MsrA [Pseudomonadales bacterium]